MKLAGGKPMRLWGGDVARTSWPDSRILRELARRDPESGESAAGAGDTDEAAELLRSIVGAAPGGLTRRDSTGAGSARLGQHRSRHRLVAGRWRGPALVAAAAVVTVALLTVIVVHLAAPVAMTGPTTTPVRAAAPFRPPGAASPGHVGTWRLLSTSLSGTWKQNVDGPPPGRLTCASPGACYVMAGKYRSPDVGSPLLSESLYVTNDLGASWAVLPMPSGFDPTAALSCWAAASCATGGTLRGQPMFLTTVDGGRQWTLVPVASVPGVLLRLHCSSARACDGIVGPQWTEDPVGAPSGPPGESFVTTADGGTSWTVHRLAPEDNVTGFACAGTEHCLVVGRTSGRSATPKGEVDFVRSTADGGRSWAPGRFPAGFELGPISGLSCADAAHCFVTGMIPIATKNPPQCAAVHAPGGSSGSAGLPPMSPAVAARSRAESAIAAQAAREEGRSPVFDCTFAAVEQVSDIASSSNGGITWTPEALPADVPDPQLGSIACASTTRCWASGSEAVPQRIGASGENLGSPVLLGTTDGGRNWSRVVFTVPADAPDAFGQSFLSVGDVSCPAANACIALGAAAQSAPTAPVYSLVTVPRP